MCGAIWSQEKWIDATNNKIAGYENEYKLLKTRYTDAGARAIQIENRFGSHYVTNVYSEGGYDYDNYLTKSEANKLLKEHGFTLKTDPTLVVEAAQASATVALADTDPTTVTSPEQVTEDMVVQGRTIAQWREESERNERRNPKDHVHPEAPADGSDPSILEMAAFIASTTVEESIVLMLMSMGGAPSDLFGAVPLF